jgi:hypothetical protein
VTALSLKQIEPAAVELVGDELRPLSVFGPRPVEVTDPGGPACVDAAGGRLLLPPGLWLVAFQGQAEWRTVGRVNIRAIIGGDPRHHGPRVTLHHERGAQVIWETVELPRGAAWEQSVTRPFSAFGLVSIPDTGEADGVSVELMASAPRGVRGLDVEFRDVELLAVGAGAP